MSKTHHVFLIVEGNSWNGFYQPPPTKFIKTIQTLITLTLLHFDTQSLENIQQIVD
jgi:hypothetical protein